MHAVSCAPALPVRRAASYMAADYDTLAASMDQVLAWVGQGRLSLQVSHR